MRVMRSALTRASLLVALAGPRPFMESVNFAQE